MTTDYDGAKPHTEEHTSGWRTDAPPRGVRCLVTARGLAGDVGVLVASVSLDHEDAVWVCNGTRLVEVLAWMPMPMPAAPAGLGGGAVTEHVIYIVYRQLNRTVTALCWRPTEAEAVAVADKIRDTTTELNDDFTAPLVWVAPLSDVSPGLDAGHREVST